MTTWKEILTRTSRNLTEFTSEEIEAQVDLYFRTLKEAMDNVERPEYDFFFVGKLRVNKKILSVLERRLSYYRLEHKRIEYMEYFKKIREII